MSRTKILPLNWVSTTFEGIGELNPKNNEKQISEDDEVTFLPMTCVSEMSGRIDTSNVRKYGSVKKGYTQFADGDLLFAKITPCMENGKIAIAKDLKNGIGCGSTEFHVIRLSKEISTKFYFFYLIQSTFRKEAQRSMTGSAGQLRVPKNFLTTIPIPLPPLPEQHRIVAKIEELFTQLDAGVAALTTALAQLKRYRQSVLKAAFEGRLTEEWRERHADNKAIEIVTQIVADNDHIQGLSKIPENWVWSNIGKVSHLIQYGTSEKASEDSNGIPILRMGNIQDGKLIFEGLKYLPSDFPDLEKYKLQDGDVLFNRTNSAELVGKSAVYKEKHPASVFASYLIRVRSNADLCQPDLLSYFINSPFGKIYIKSVVSQQVGQANVNGTKLANMPIPLPPLTEQYDIVAEIERRFTIIDEMEKTIQQSLKQAERLRQSILKQAFEGKLVPQDPHDEPAYLLLERIKKEKGAAKGHKNTKRSEKNKTTQQELI